MEYGVDLTDLTDKVDVTRPLRYFLIIHSKSKARGEGKVLQASVMDYHLDKEAVEYPFSGKNVSIRNAGETTMISTVVPGLDLKAPLNVVASATGLTWSPSPQTALKPVAYRVLRNGKPVATTCDTLFNIGGTATDSALYAVKAVYLVGGDSLVSPASKSVSFLTMNHEKAYARKTLNFTQGAFTIPHVCDVKRDTYTIEYWLKASKVDDWTESIGHDWGGCFLWQVNKGGSMTAGWYTSSANQMVTEPGLIKVGVWTHLALVINGSTMTLYSLCQWGKEEGVHRDREQRHARQQQRSALRCGGKRCPPSALRRHRRGESVELGTHGTTDQRQYAPRHRTSVRHHRTAGLSDDGHLHRRRREEDQGLGSRP